MFQFIINIAGYVDSLESLSLVVIFNWLRPL